MSKILTPPSAAKSFFDHAIQTKKDVFENLNKMTVNQKVTIAINSILSSLIAGMSIACGKGHIGPRNSLAMGVVSAGAAALALRSTALEMSKPASITQEIASNNDNKKNCPHLLAERKG